jgi:hypothetical protein
MYALTGLVSVSAGETVLLAEKIQPGETFRCELALKVSGKLKAERGPGVDAVALEANARHDYLERAEAVDANGGIGKAVRFYQVAESVSKVGGETIKRSLAETRRLAVAQRGTEGTICYSPLGALRRDDLELLGEHFDTMAVPLLLPGKEVAVGATWPISNEGAQHTCLFDGLVKNELVGTLVKVENGTALVTVTGTAVGIESGAAARLKIDATLILDLTAKRITRVTWKQQDEREAGPVSPASEATAEVEVKRTLLTDEPKELDAAVRAKVPEKDPTDTMLLLQYQHPDGLYEFTHPRDWHVIGQSKDHLVMRLIEKNTFVAQLTITGWKPAEAGKHTPPEEFKEMVNKVMTWKVESTEREAEIPMEGGRWLYQIVQKGTQEGVAVVQRFYLLADQAGSQVAVSVLSPADQVAKLQTRDLALIKTLTLGKK